MIDSNESKDVHNSKWGKFMEDNMLHDVHDALGQEKPTTTRLNSTTVIDYMVVTEGLLPYISKAGHLALHEGIVSDHIMLWFDININRFFGSRVDGSFLELKICPNVQSR